MRPEELARAHLAARNYGFAESTAREAVAKNPNQVAPLAAQVEILHAAGKDKEARDAYRLLEPLARWSDRDLPVFLRLELIVARWRAEGTWTSSAPQSVNTSGTDETTIDRIDLNTLGPLVWAPFPAELFSRTDITGSPWALVGKKGKNVLVIFFLGGKCAHCMQQLQLFSKEYEALKKLNVETVAISTDDLEAAKSLRANKDGIKFAMPMLADPKLELFKLYRAYDDFEGQPLHGTFLIDAQGNIRFQRMSADPFLDVEFIKTEAERVTRILRPR
jgi:peroxiredoxin